jgi:VanZ family protein
MRRVLGWAPPILYMALIFYMSSLSHPVPELTEHVWDKLLHFGGYGVLGILFYRAFAGERFSVRYAILLAILSSSVYGATDEWHQAFVPSRSSDVHDWMADTTGAALGAVAFAAAARRQYGLTSDASTSTDTA